MWVARRRARTRRTGSGLTTSLGRLHPCRRPGGRRRPRQFRAHRQYTGARGHGSTLVGARDTASHERRARPQPVRRLPRLDRRARPPRRRPPRCLDRRVGGDGWVRRALRPRHQRAGRAGDFRPRLRRPAGIAGRARSRRPACGGCRTRRTPTAVSSSPPSTTLPAPSSDPTRLLDVVVYEATDEHRHVDVRRHGTPLVRFDPDGLLVLRDDDEAELRRGAARDRRPDPPAPAGRRVAGQPRHRPQPPARGGLALPAVRATARRSSCSAPATAPSATTTCSATSTPT